MAQSSTIEWTQATWNPVVGCEKVSSGCLYCYAERMAQRLASMAESSEAVGRNAGRKSAYRNVVDDRGRWNGRAFPVEAALEEPLKWRTPRLIFVNSMSDLFHRDIADDYIKRVFDIMNECPQHTFQILTKRPERAAAISRQLEWPPNIWMGTSVENRKVLNRVRWLQKTNAQVRFISAEPLLGPLPNLTLKGIDWVIVGGESGPGARPMDVDWVRDIRNLCEINHVRFFFKQWGGVNKKKAGRVLDDQTWDDMPHPAGVSSHVQMEARAAHGS